MFQKQMQGEMLDQKMLENKKSLQNHLATDYITAARLKQQRQQEERNSSINVDKAINSRVNMEMDYLANTEQK